MSIRVMTWVWEHSAASGTDLLVLLAIADNADDKGGNAWPSIATLARKCRVSERSIQRAIWSASQAGWLLIEPNAGRSGTHRFTVVMREGRQLVTPDEMSPRQLDTGDMDVTGGVTPVSPEPSLNHPVPPLPPASGGLPDHCPRHRSHRKTCPDCQTAKADAKARPPWCGQCDEKTRLRDFDGDHPHPCPDCNPRTERKSA